MKCPLFWLGCITSARQVESKHGDCLKEGCAWWDAPAERCVILQLAFELDEIHCWLEKFTE